MKSLKTPLTEKDIMDLDVGDNILLSGTIFTARDRAHLFFLDEDFPKIKNSILYHCGPIVKDNKIISAGPTTSARLSAYTPQVIEKYGINAVIGKGGMDKSTLEAMKGKAVYLAAIGGAGALIASQIKEIKSIAKEEFGMPEAIYELEVEDFPAIVAMDAKGNSLYDEVQKSSDKKFRELLQNL